MNEYEQLPTRRVQGTALVSIGTGVYERNLARCGRTLRERIASGVYASAADFSLWVGVPVESVVWFMSARPHVTLEQIEAILLGLGLTFDDVHQRVPAMRACGTML